MDKKIAGLLGAVAGLATIGSAQAAPVPSQPAAQSYADLLAPIPNAAATLTAEDAAQATPQEMGGAQLAQYYYYYDRPYYYHRHHHHHHHHHHHGVVFGPGGVWVR